MSQFRKNYNFLAPPSEMPVKVKPLLRVAIVPTPEFTLISFACFVDFLRHCSDESDFSRQVYCHWTLLSHNRKTIRASCGFNIQPQTVFARIDPRDFDFIVIHGGLLCAPVPDELYEFAQRADACGVPLVGSCTGSFVLAELGLLDGRRCAVHFTLQHVMQEMFPKVLTAINSPVVRDGPYTTCAGGLATVDMAVLLTREYCGKPRMHKAAHYLRTDRGPEDSMETRQQEEIMLTSLDRRLSSAVGMMRQHMRRPYAIGKLANRVGATERNLSRLFFRYLKTSPSKYWRDIRLEMAHHLVVNTDFSMMQIADECGFTDDSHLAKRFSMKYKLSPATIRNLRNKAGMK